MVLLVTWSLPLSFCCRVGYQTLFEKLRSLIYSTVQARMLQEQRWKNKVLAEERDTAFCQEYIFFNENMNEELDKNL